jgi:acyl-CoA thioesterase
MDKDEVLLLMLERDRFSHWLGLEIEEYRQGYCRLRYPVKDEMLNGFNIVHGGILFAASDSAFAFACNSHGHLAVALDASINFTRPVKPGERLTVEASEIHLGNKVGVYEVRTVNEKGELVAHFKGTAYRTEKELG